MGCGSKGIGKNPIEPFREGGVGLVLRPSHIKSNFSETFHFGLTFIIQPYSLFIPTSTHLPYKYKYVIIFK